MNCQPMHTNVNFLTCVTTRKLMQHTQKQVGEQNFMTIFIGGEGERIK